MTFIIYKASCRKHDVMEELVIRGRGSIKNVNAGYEILERKMPCSDFNIIHSIINPKTDREIAAWYEKSIKLHTKGEINAEYTS